MQAVGRKQRDKGRQDIDIHLLKPDRFRADPQCPSLHEADVMYDETLDPSAIHVTYPYRIAHPLLRFLPMKLAQYIGDNFRKRLGIPRKQDKTRWSTEELNSILMHNLASDMMKTFGCIQWENDKLIGKPKARCYPFNMPGHKFRGKNPKVLHI